MRSPAASMSPDFTVHVIADLELPKVRGLLKLKCSCNRSAGKHYVRSRCSPDPSKAGDLGILGCSSLRAARLRGVDSPVLVVQV